MKTNYTIKNFRVFDKKGVTVEIAPLTFLVGCNSSGKSSIVKSLTLLKTFFKQEFSIDHPVIGSTIDFSVKPNDSLGSFRNVVRSSSKDKTFTLAYDVYSDYLKEDVNVALTVGEGNLGNGRIIGLRIAKLDGSVIIGIDNQSELSGSLINIKEAFRKYLEDVNNSGIASCDSGKTDMLAIDRFIETGIMTYFSVLDEIRDVSSPYDLNNALKSIIEDNKYKDILEKAIDLICKDFGTKRYASFLDYYRSLEDKTIYLPDLTKRIIPDILEGDGSHGLRREVGFSQRISSYDDFLELLADDRPSGIRLFDSLDNKDIRNYNSAKRSIDYYFVFKTLSSLRDNSPFSSVVVTDKETMTSTLVHNLFFETFKEYLGKFLDEVLTKKDITEDIDYISSTRIQVRRMYPLEDRTEFTNAVRKYSDTKDKFMTLGPPIRLNLADDSLKYTPTVVSSFVPGSFMNKWLRVFNIGDHMTLDMDKNGLSLLLKVFKSESDKNGVLLADMGYGITQLFSILLQIEEMIMSSLYKKYNGLVTPKEAKKNGVEYFITNYTDSPFEACTVAIEEPEIHLHPRFQSLLAEMFYEAYKEYNIQFIVETHSEYLLRKIQTLVAEKERELAPDEVSIIYVEDDSEVTVDRQKVRRIPIKEDGCLAASFGAGFYDQADSLALKLFDLKFGLK